ncbi:MAG: TetR/AcrR family transcriptional regulator [Acidimicrobiia bacterium]|nr:TetR/AcrR family transcriptional regulator [Acidimicrobiia bacterium]MDH3399065.1 TetR/AcrR family transcriptional regulator [Acidimicrobiia bacterium]
MSASQTRPAAQDESYGLESSEAAREAPTARGRQRQEQIIEAATQLFHLQGFHATSMDEIGTAAGITGPGLYRHFSSKDDILLAVFDRIWDLLRDAIERSAGLEPGAALDVLIDTHTTLALDQGAELMLLVRELRYVPEYYQRAAERNDARYTDAWAEVVIKLHPELSLDEARAVGRGLIGLVGSAAREGSMGLVAKSHHRQLLRQMCRASLQGVE